MTAQPHHPTTTISAAAAPAHFDELVERANASNEHIVVERDGQAVLVLLSAAQYETLVADQMQAERIRRLDEAARAIGQAVHERGLSEDDLDAMIEATRER